MERTKVKIAIVGCGSITQDAHLPAALESKYCDVFALVDRNIDIARFITKKCKCKDSVEGTPSVITQLKIWYGAVETIPTNSEQVNALSTYIYNNLKIVNLETGVQFKKFIIVIPANQVTNDFVIATDISNFNAQLTYDKIDEFLVETPIGNRNYKIFSLQVGNPYPLSATHRFYL